MSRHKTIRTLFLVTAAAALLLPATGRTETVEVKPDRYYVTFSAAHPPVARIRPGDSVITKLLDSRGRDETGKLILDGDNVLTGPFYVEGAEAGDTLVVRLERVRLNRDWGWDGTRVSLDALAPRSIEGLESANCCEEWLQPGRRNALKWTLDLERGIIKPSRLLGSRAKLEFPAHPTVGCIGVAPALRQAISSGPAGEYGGNLDYNRMDEGAIVSLPVFEPGALLMLGDGHAGFGDGELLGQGTETSMDVQFSVSLRKRHRIGWPRVEHPESLVTLGATTGALERGFREAISEMLRWLMTDYGLTQQEAHTLLGLAAELRVASWFSTSMCEVPKKYLPPPRR
ncbi:MAG: acetamidase/formamidase family protein [Acidobacteriia bacterium]|nr:acetamidase/formamidase family protein [Terriglobia bacterium]